MERLSLGQLTAGPRGGLVLSEGGSAPVAADYSRFKYGDGSVSARYGALLADAFVPRALKQGAHRLAVTSSAFGYAPTAAHSLLTPFLIRARQLAGSRIDIVPFKVRRSSISNGDYATMSRAQRSAALSHHALSVKSSMDLAEGLVAVLDDVRVTGVHEKSIDGALRSAGATEVSHLYLVDAYEWRNEPHVEAVLNGSHVRTLADLVEMCHLEHFIPNARICKWVVTASAREQKYFLDCAPKWVVHWVLQAAQRDGLRTYDTFHEGVVRLEKLVGAHSVPA